MKKLFNLPRYKELLEQEKNGEISLLDREFLSYSASVEMQICYDRKKDYFILIHEYLSRSISPCEFRSKFLQMDKEDFEKSNIIIQDFQKLEVFTLAKDLEKFANLQCQISTLCFEYDEVWDGTMERMSESEFYDLVNKYYLQLQEAFPSEDFK